MHDAGSSSQKSNDSIWDSWYRSYQTGSVLPGVRYPNEHLVRFMAQWRRSPLWPSEGRPRIMEFGFGTVANMAMMARFGADVEGLEVSADAVERAKGAIDAFGMQDCLSVDTYEGGWKVPRPDSRFDCLVGLQCVYYNLDQAAFAAECARMLKPGGLLFLSFFSPRHGYMGHIEGRPGGPVEFRPNHPNPRLVGLHPFLYRDEAQFGETYGAHFDIKVGLDEFDLLPVYQSWFYLRGQKKDAPEGKRLHFPLSTPASGQAGPLAPAPADADAMIDANVRIWSAYTATLTGDPFPGQKYPDEQIVRFLATWKRRRRESFFVGHVGAEDVDSKVVDMPALEIDPLNPVHMEAMHSLGYAPHAVSSMPAALEAVHKGLDAMGLSGRVATASWDGRVLPYADKTMNTVVAAKSAYYSPDQRAFAAECARVVRPGGEIFLFYICGRHGYCRHMEPVEGNIYRFTADHPNPALAGLHVFLGSPGALREIWEPWFEVQVKHFEFSTYEQFSAFHVVVGVRKSS